jgi:hypothetical protein
MAAAALAGCSPGLDWRETRPDGDGLVVLFPCRPDRHARTVTLARTAGKMEMLVCSAAGATFGLSFIDVPDPGAVSSTLTQLQAAALDNIGGTQLSSEPARVAGMTANANAVRLAISGRLPDGAAVQEAATFFVKGLRVYQASVIGPRLAPEMTDTYFAGLKFPS